MQAKVACDGVGVTPLVRLNRSSIRFAATAAGDMTRSSCYVTNISHKPQRFEFAPPPGSMVQIAPMNGMLRANETRRIALTLKPDSDFFAKLEASAMGDAGTAGEATVQSGAQPDAAASKNIDTKLNLEEAAADAVAAADPTPKSASGKKMSPLSSQPSSATARKPAAQAAATAANDDTGSAAANAGASAAVGSGDVPVQDTAGVPDGEAAAVTAVPEEPEGHPDTSHGGQLVRMTIPCAVQTGDGLHGKSLHLSEFEARNLINLEVEMPIVPPPITIVEGSRSMYFPDVAVGSQSIQEVTIKNNTNRDLRLRSTEMDTSGPYRISGNLRSIGPYAEKNIAVCFEPRRSGSFFDSLEVACDLMKIKFNLKGVGIQPNLQIASNEVDLGDCLAGHTATQSLKLSNVSPFPVTFSVRLGGSNLTNKWCCPLPASSTIANKTKTPEMTSLGSAPAFSFSPASCTITPESETEVVFTFAPDRASRNWVDYAYIKLSTEPNEQEVKLFGRCWNTPAFCIGGEITMHSVEEDVIASMLSNTALPEPAEEDEKGKKGGKADEAADPAKKKAHAEPEGERRRLHFDYSLLHGKAVCRTLTLGMVESAAKEKLKADFHFEHLSSNLFTIDSMSGHVDPSEPKAVEIKFDPAGKDVGVSEGATIRATVHLALKVQGNKTPFEIDLHVSVKA